MPKSSLVDQWVDTLVNADLNNQPRPLLGDQLKVTDPDTAYEVQAAFVSRRLNQGAKIAGYKAALTATTAQKIFSASGPAGGVLFSSGQFYDGASLKLSDFRKAALEVEIGYRLKTAINSPVTSETVMDYIGEIMPMIEVADLGYASPDDPDASFTIIDLVAGNSASAAFISGSTPGFSGDVNKVAVTLSLSNAKGEPEILFDGIGSEAMGNQLEALTWLINHTLSQSHPLEAGHLLMTGTLGKIYPAHTGDFTADYGELGQINFSFSD
ncbi:MAG: hypothetical protein KUG75_05750 [Pseudomonadales bacterium]|nr:hypothetical protein [Pseudomonadales bacterium]